MGPKTYNIYQKNPKKIYQGSHYAIQGTGGFVIKDSYSVKMSAIHNIGKYDMTNAVQILYSANRLNNMLGGFNCITGRFHHDCITIRSEEFCNMLKTDIVSVGSLDSIYFDYKKHIQEYFGFAGSMFVDEVENVFDNGSLLSLLHEKTICPYSGEITNACNGYIEIKNIDETLHKMCDLNIFGNRHSSDISNGFLSGDLVYVKGGIEISMDIDMKIDNGVRTILENTLNCNSNIACINVKKKYMAPLLIRVT